MTDTTDRPLTVGDAMRKLADNIEATIKRLGGGIDRAITWKQFITMLREEAHRIASAEEPPPGEVLMPAWREWHPDDAAEPTPAPETEGEQACVQCGKFHDPLEHFVKPAPAQGDVVERLEAASIALALRWEHHDPVEMGERSGLKKLVEEAAADILSLRAKLAAPTSEEVGPVVQSLRDEDESTLASLLERLARDNESLRADLAHAIARAEEREGDNAVLLYEMKRRESAESRLVKAREALAYVRRRVALLHPDDPYRNESLTKIDAALADIPQ